VIYICVFVRYIESHYVLIIQTPITLYFNDVNRLVYCARLFLIMIILSCYKYINFYV